MIRLRHIWRLNASKLPPLAPQNMSLPDVVGYPLLGQAVAVDTGSWIDSVTPPAKKYLLGVEFGASVDGVNGDNGYQSGQYEERIFEEGQFQITFANGPGSDGASHLDRFLVTATPKMRGDATSMVNIFRPGDEWIEVWDEGQLLYVGCVVQASPGRQQLVVQGSDPTFLLKKTREFWAGYWAHSPRDVFEHYTSVWQAVIADDFQKPNFDFVADRTMHTTDGRWQYTRSKDGPANTVRIAPGAEGQYGRVRATDDYAIEIGLQSTDVFNFWRVETQFTRPLFGDNAWVRVGLWDIEQLYGVAFIQFKENYTNVHVWDDITSDMRIVDLKVPTDPPGPYQVVVEGREGWIYFFVNQTLLGVIAMPDGPFTCVPYVEVSTGSAATPKAPGEGGGWIVASATRPDSAPATDAAPPTEMEVEEFVAGAGDTTVSKFAFVYADFQYIILRRTVPYLMNQPLGMTLRGDYHLDAPLPPGGLNAVYYNDVQLHSRGSYGVQVFNPNQKNIIAQRKDAMLMFFATDFTAEDPDAFVQWWPTGTTKGLWWSVRWTGAIRLELKDTDYKLRYTTLNEGARMWLGKTRRTEEYIDNWLVGLGGTHTGPWMRSHLGPDDDGEFHNAWYPIKIEYGQRGTPGAEFYLEYTTDGEGWIMVQTEMLSTYGIFNDTIRLDSHAEVLKTLMDTFALQARFEPRPLEHPAFPGEFVPRNRVGRDTNKVIDADEALDYTTQINSDTVLDTILADGSGLADNNQNAQLTLEGVQFEDLEQRMMVMSDYETFGDMAQTVLMDQRINSLLALRASPWEEVNAAPRGSYRHQYIDAFPMSGDLAEFFWRPGDGVRISLPEIGVNDGSPRQILGVQRTFQTEGLQAAVVSFRQRPRNLGEFMRGIQRRIANKGRNYQGQIVRTTGTAGDLMNPSVIPLPSNLGDVSKVEITVLTVPAKPLYVYVNGMKTGLPPISQPGTYDITAYVSRRGSDPKMIVELKES